MTKKRILVVDDEPSVRFGLRHFLEAHSYEVYEADSCHQALEMFLTARPDVAVIDYKLADGDALSLLPRLREIDSTKQRLHSTAAHLRAARAMPTPATAELALAPRRIRRRLRLRSRLASHHQHQRGSEHGDMLANQDVTPSFGRQPLPSEASNHLTSTELEC